MEECPYLGAKLVKNLCRNPNFLCGFDTSPPLDTILGQMTPVDIFNSCLFKIYYNIIFLPTLKHSKWSFYFSFSTPSPHRRILHISPTIFFF
jgi:hypothetical protein